MRLTAPCVPRVALALLLCASQAARAGVTVTVSGPADAPTVVVLHGLNRGSASMAALAAALADAGFHTLNVDYPSSAYPVERLVVEIEAALRECCAAALARAPSFVTHSLGGLIVRQWARLRPELRVARVVMLAPPNRGTELVDAYAGSALFELIVGPAGLELGTGPQDLPGRLGPVAFELGVIAGRGSLNPIHSWMIPGDDDGTVGVERTRVDGMRDHVVVDASHFFIVCDDEAIREAVHFLRHGRFAHDARTAPAPP